jgi:hypothetical protein
MRSPDANARRRGAQAHPDRTSSLLGDTIMLTPLIAKCRAALARCRNRDDVRGALCRALCRPTVRRSRIAVRSRDPATLKPLLAQTGFDLALIPGDNRLSWLARALGARWIVAFSGDSPR